MFHQILFLMAFGCLLPLVVFSPFSGVLIYNWLEDMPPAATYTVTLLPDNLSFITAALTFFMWLLRERKSIPYPPTLCIVLVVSLFWISLTTLYAIVPDAAVIKWDRTIEVVGFSILSAQMMTTRSRIEGFVWILVLATSYFGIPGAIKTIVGGAAGVGSGEVVVAEAGSFFGDRVTFSVVLAMTVPFALYLGRQATLVPSSRWLKLGMFGVAISFLIALIGTFARTALLAGGSTLLMLVIKSRYRTRGAIIAAAVIVLLVEIAPESWFTRMDTTIAYEADASAEGRLKAWAWAWDMAVAHPIVGGGFRVFVLDTEAVGGVNYTEAHNIFFETVAEQGFVGLVLFTWLLVGTYRCCRTVQKRVRDLEEFIWAFDLARAIQIGLVAFVVGGMFVSISTSPFIYNLVALTIGLRTIVEHELPRPIVKSLRPSRGGARHS